jgi:cytochrome c oxidase subunit 1
MSVIGTTPSLGRQSLFTRLHGWTTTVDHKRLGVMYVVSGLAFLLVAGTEASIMRLQLALPEQDIVGHETFNSLFTMHGTTMIWLVGMPILFGMANFLVPLMIGARDMAFPRLNALGYWLFLFGALLLYFSYLGAMGLYGAGSAPDVGWFAYAPLTARVFSRGHSTDYWILGIMVSGLGSVATALNIITTIIVMRCRGMSFMKMPLFCWMMLVTSVLVLVAFAPLTAAQVMLLFDRTLGSHFFNPELGGSAVLWEHLFWFFGHPEVYIFVLPAFGFISEVVPVFSRKVLFGYPLMVAATVIIGFLSVAVWAHHLFAIGMGPELNTYFAAASMLIGIPTGIKIFNWLATMYGGRIRFQTPMLFATGFLAMFTLGGLTGVMLAVAPFDFQVTDTYFVVAHFHWVLFGGVLLSIFAAVYYWFPKVTGRMLSERLGKWHFWLLLSGFFFTFGPMHISGLLGMPRRIYTYPTGHGWDIWNLISSLAVLLQIAGILLFVINVIRTMRKGQLAGDDPWDAWTLEWSTTSPPPPYNFATTPTIMSRRPLWDIKHPEDPDWKFE